VYVPHFLHSESLQRLGEPSGIAMGLHLARDAEILCQNVELATPIVRSSKERHETSIVLEELLDYRMIRDVTVKCVELVKETRECLEYKSATKQSLT
jgi:hypothetical protein